MQASKGRDMSVVALGEEMPLHLVLAAGSHLFGNFPCQLWWDGVS